MSYPTNTPTPTAVGVGEYKNDHRNLKMKHNSITYYTEHSP